MTNSHTFPRSVRISVILAAAALSAAALPAVAGAAVPAAAHAAQTHTVSYRGKARAGDPFDQPVEAVEDRERALVRPDI
jgi:hypothetical protein